MCACVYAFDALYESTTLNSGHITKLAVADVVASATQSHCQRQSLFSEM